MHDLGYIHSDQKPANIMIGLNEKNSTVYLIDFGLSKRWRDPDTFMHLPLGDGRNLSGTARYASLHNHFGYTKSRRDDLEEHGHVLLYFLKGTLPWEGISNPVKKIMYDEIKDVKVSVPLKNLTEGFPEEFHQYMLYVRNLGFTERPNYNYLRQLFSGLFERCAFTDRIMNFTEKETIKAGKLYYCPGEEYEDNYGTCSIVNTVPFWK